MSSNVIRDLNNIYLNEVSADKALEASKAADIERGKAAAAGDKEKAKAKAAQASRLYKKQADKRLNREDKDWGYDKKGNSLNPVDIEKRKRKDDDLAGAPKSHNKSTSQGQRMGGKSTIYKEEKNWIQKAVKRPGAFTAKANKHDMGVQQFAKYVDDNPKKFDTRTKRQANLAQTFASMKKEDMDEMVEILGEVFLEG